MRAMLQGMSAGIGISYAPLSQDYSQSNYSSSRLSLIDDRENWKVLQQYLIDNFITPVYEAWLDAAVRSGVLRLAGYESMPERFRRARWMCRGWAWVDPVKEVMAYKDAVRSGFATQSQIVSELGGDLEELMLQRQQEVERAGQLGLSFDTDPAQDADAQRLEAEEVSIASEQDADDDGTA
jgi:lambda family phage portal protein